MSKFVYLCLVLGSAAALADPVPDALFNDVAAGLRCPTCTGLSVLDSEAKFSLQIKSQVAKQLEAGKSKDEIYAFFEQRYGPWILREPPATGFNLIAWAIPIGILSIGPLLLVLLISRARSAEFVSAPRSIEDIKSEWESMIAAARQEAQI